MSCERIEHCIIIIHKISSHHFKCRYSIFFLLSSSFVLVRFFAFKSKKKIESNFLDFLQIRFSLSVFFLSLVKALIFFLLLDLRQ
jgi:hypothetical protein